jgi:hypothetical protein
LNRSTILRAIKSGKISGSRDAGGAWQRLSDPNAVPHPEGDTVVERFYVDTSIAGVFIGLVYLICLLHVFSKL